jgi:hypothetical protein
MDCRFCLLPQEEVKNPLVSPCACIGSVKYVHIDCLRKWRELSENPESGIRCQLCLTTFDLFLKWPIEHVPDIQTARRWFLFYKPLLVSLFVYYLNTLIYLKSVDEDDLLNYNDVMMFYLYDNRSQTFFLASLTGVTIYYFLVYSQYLYNVRSKYVYAQYWLKTKVFDVHPRNLLFHTIINLIFACFYSYPFGFLYFFALPKLLIVHVHILQKMNIDAQLL